MESVNELVDLIYVIIDQRVSSFSRADNISLFSALIALFSLWINWRINIHHKKKLFLVNPDNLYKAIQGRPEFVLINAGNKDIAIVDIKCAFGDPERGRRYSAAEIKIGDNNKLIVAGQSVICSVDFKDELIKWSESETVGINFSKYRTKDNQEELEYEMPMYVYIKWADTDGKLNKRMIDYASIILRENKGIVGKRISYESYELYSNKKHD